MAPSREAKQLVNLVRGAVFYKRLEEGRQSVVDGRVYLHPILASDARCQRGQCASVSDGVVAFLGRARQLIGRVSNARGQPPSSAGMHATIAVGYEIHTSLPLLSTTE
jgi:hypothetical protein